MKALLPPWPREMPRNFTPRANFAAHVPAHQIVDALALERARRLRLEQESLGGVTGTWTELLFANRQDFTALASFTTDASLIAGGGNEQPVLGARYFDGLKAWGRTVRLVARGILSTTSTPTYTFTVRLGTTQGAAFLSGTTVGATVAITTQSGVTNVNWEMQLDLTCNSPGMGTTNTTLSGTGWVMSPAGFASPFTYPLLATSATNWTAAIDGNLDQYLNISVASSASNASNTLTCKQVYLAGLN